MKRGKTYLKALCLGLMGFGLMWGGEACAEGAARGEYSSTAEFIELNLYDYNEGINSRWLGDKKYPGFQWNGGAYEGRQGTGLYIVDAIDFGNSKINDHSYSGKNHGKSSTAYAVGNAGGEINRIDLSAGAANRPIGMSTGGQVMANRLIDGYPALKDGTSLSWLFTENEAVKKLNTATIDGLFLQDGESGLYTYDSRKNHAQYADNFFTRYESVITPNFICYPFGNFLPLNDIAEADRVSEINNISEYIDGIRAELGSSETDAQLDYMLGKYTETLKKAGLARASAGHVLRDFISSGRQDSPGGTGSIPEGLLQSMYNIGWDKETNFFFGMEMGMKFMMPEGGYTGPRGDTPMVFSFSGDDDVWVYIDGVLFLDLSGIHRHVGGRIDFVEGRVDYFGLNTKTGDVDMDSEPYASFSFSELLENAGVGTDALGTNGTFRDNSQHELRFYYMERGSGSSVCSISFNFPLLPQTGELDGLQPTAIDEGRDNDPGMAWLSLPSMGLEAPVMSRWSYAKLEDGPCRYSGSISGGDLVVLAHNKARQFGRLAALAEGTELVLTDTEGQTLRYRAVRHERLQPWESSRLCAGEYPLSLFTCTGDSKGRHVVRFERAQEE